MKRYANIFAAVLAGAALASFASCTPKARIEGSMPQDPKSEIVAYRLNGGSLQLIDTVKTDSKGNFRIKAELRKGEPDFVHIYRKGKMLAPVLVSAGDKVSVSLDTLGGFDVKGPADAELYCQAEKDYRTFRATMDSLYRAGENVACNRTYIDYYHKCVRFVLANSHSLAVVPVLCQTFGEGVPVFAQTTDAIHFRSAADSLQTVYPNSKYVKLIRKSAKDRTQFLGLNLALETASSVEFPEIELPDIEAVPTKLSDVNAKLVMLYFWSPSVPLQKMFNVDTLMSLYQKYNKKGFEIYAVALESDKIAWATTVRAQMLPWINVCDTNGAASKYATLYNVTQTPWAFFMRNGKFVEDKATSGEEIDKVLAKYLN